MKEIKSHAYARGTLTVTYVDDSVEKFHEVSEEEHEAFLRTRKEDDTVVPTTAFQAEAALEKLRTR